MIFTEPARTEVPTTVGTIFTDKALALDISDHPTDQDGVTAEGIMAGASWRRESWRRESWGWAPVNGDITCADSFKTSNASGSADPARILLGLIRILELIIRFSITM